MRGTFFRPLAPLAGLVLLALAPLAGAAQEKAAPAAQGGAKVEYEKKTVINFEEDTIEGDLKRPDGEYVESRKRVDHSNLIKIRESWRDKVMQSSGDL
jgi:hypothetical protein